MAAFVSESGGGTTIRLVCCAPDAKAFTMTAMTTIDTKRIARNSTAYPLPNTQQDTTSAQYGALSADTNALRVTEYLQHSMSPR
jgi:hypothetical protein